MSALGPLALLLPALIPSWNFFETINASPRIDYAVTDRPGGAAPEDAWRAFRPPPGRLPLAAMLGRLVWNARWNETLFVVSCAERLLVSLDAAGGPDAHSQDEIFRRIAADLADAGEGQAGWLRFRIVLVSEEDGVLAREAAFVSEPQALARIAVR